jgi:hypothetical protein
MSLDYACEKYWAGVGTLAEGQGRIKERLLDAFRSQVSRATESVLDGVEAETVQRIAKLNRQMEGAEDRGQGTLAARIEDMSEDEAKEITTEIVSILYALTFQRQQEARGRA